MRSPVGKALLKRKVGDDVLVMRPAGEIEMTLIELKYGE
ncbi:MAG: GreA/GreB family elongation factor [Myxococcota bacterium]